MSDLARAIDTPQPAAEPWGIEASTEITIQPQIGPGSPAGLRRCIVCLDEFRSGETWLRMAPSDGGYAIGIHTHCYRAGS